MALKTAQARADSKSHIYLTFSVTDPVHGSLTFHWGSEAFSATNAYGGAWVSKCVLSWGNLVKYSPEGSDRQNQAVVRLALDAYVTATNVASKRFAVHEVLQNIDVRDQAVTIYQWNADDSAQEAIWKGYWGGIVGHDFSGGVASVDVSFSSLERDSTDSIGAIVTRDAFPNAPDDAIGMMSPKGYGSFVATIDTAGESSTKRLDPLVLGYGGGAGLAVPLDESPAYAQPATRYRICQNDGLASALTFGLNVLPTGSGDFWIFDSSIGGYAHVNNDGTNLQGAGNTTAETYVELSNAPVVWFSLRPTVKASSTSAGLTDVQACIDDDPTNYVTLDGANPDLGLECPAISLPSGAEVQEVRIAVDMWTDTGAMDIGLYDAVGANYAGSPSYQTIQASSLVIANNIRCQFVSSAAGGTGGGAVYGAAAFNSEGTLPEFTRGQFMYIDSGSSNQRKPYHIRLARSSGEKRIYTVALLVKVVYPKIKVGEKPLTWQKFDPETQTIVDEPVPWGGVKDIFGAPKSAPGIQLIFTGEYQEDDGSGTITGTASALITKAPDVARHLIQVVGGKPVNSTAGTLGNFVDARAEDVAGEKKITAVYGPGQVYTRNGALNELMARVPWLKVYMEDGVGQCLVDHTNPLESQIYRSVSDTVEIEPWDIVEGNIAIEERDSRTFVNKVTVNCGHAYGRNSPVASFTYDNPLSQAYWGATQERVIDESWIHVPDLATGAPEAAKFFARYFGRVAARPRLRVTVDLTQKFYDLRPGHALQFSKNMESAGIRCPAYRTGRADYAYPSDTAANQADNTTPTLVSGGSVNRSPAWGVSQQTDHLTFYVSGAGAYTDNANPWQYYDGSAWQNLTGVSCSDGGAVASVFERTGAITVSWTRPTITSHRKAELTYNSALRGPVYWYKHNADTVVSAADGNAITDFTPRWWGRIFLVRETNRKVGVDGYPFMQAVLEEVV